MNIQHLVGSVDPNYGPHAFRVSALATQPSPQAPGLDLTVQTSLMDAYFSGLDPSYQEYFHISK